uniref:Prefoldin subunit 1 n=1 Tax=Schistocephalus solidus TaxID=70667 RepID=A0A0X3NZM4_SCHSO
MSEKGMDPDIQKAVIELKNKTTQANQQIGFLNAQINALNTQIRRSELVTEQVKELPDGTNTYSSVGRMFIQKSVSEIISDLADQRKECQHNVESLQAKLDYVNKGLQEAQQGLRDLISLKQQKM